MIFSAFLMQLGIFLMAEFEIFNALEKIDFLFPCVKHGFYCDLFLKNMKMMMTFEVIEQC